MPGLDVQIPAPDGRSHGTLHVPDGDGPWPGVLVFPDAGGARETFGQMGDRLTDLGYVVLVPDIYYRSGEWATVISTGMAEADRASLQQSLNLALKIALVVVGVIWTGNCLGELWRLARRTRERVAAA